MEVPILMGHSLTKNVYKDRQGSVLCSRIKYMIVKKANHPEVHGLTYNLYKHRQVPVTVGGLNAGGVLQHVPNTVVKSCTVNRKVCCPSSDC